jgi:DNA-directed RNA polymerase specialized sigma24 family protein
MDSTSPDTGSVTLWVTHLKVGRRNQVRELLERYWPRLLGLAASRLRRFPHLVGYAEDVALGVFNALCRGIERGRFPNLNNRESVWQLLAVMTIRRTIDLKRKASREEQLADGSISGFSTSEPAPDARAATSDQLRHMLERLNDTTLTRIAILKGQGYENEEIATQLGCGLRTVERKLQQIREQWKTERPAVRCG